MNVLIINTFDTKGGAARAAYRLHKGLNQIGIHSSMLVKEKESQDEKVLQIKPLLDDDSLHELEIIDTITKNYIRNNRTALTNTPYSLGYPGYNLTTTEIVNNVDLINLHWVAKFQSVESISSILTLGKPVVWTLHDENPFTGGCFYSAGCTQYENDCNICPQLDNDPYKLSYYNLKNKMTLLQNKNITIVTPSKWLANAAKQSKVFGNSLIVTIPNSIETDVFAPQNKGEAKKKLGISEDTVTILTGASGWMPKRKGLYEFFSSMKYCSGSRRFKKLVNKNKLLLLCFGNPAPEFNRLNIPYKSFREVDSDMELSDIYNASDIFVLPSIEDNLPNMMLEAMSCGIPVIAFNTGGMPDMIKDKVTGRLVPFRNIKKFAKAILDLVFNAGIRNNMGKKSRELIIKKFKLEDQARKYTELFLTLLPNITDRKSPSKDFVLQKNQYCSLDLSFNNMLYPLYRKYAGAIKKF